MIRFVLLAIALTPPPSLLFANPDISTVKPDLAVPEVTDGNPEPGARVRQTHAEYAKTKVFHTLYLPPDWEPDGSYPIIVEYAGNGPYKKQIRRRQHRLRRGQQNGLRSHWGKGLHLALPPISQ